MKVGGFLLFWCKNYFNLALKICSNIKFESIKIEKKKYENGGNTLSNISSQHPYF